MVKKIKEYIPDRPDYNFKRIPGHWCEYSYDTKKIKRKCVDCKEKLFGDAKQREQAYLIRGNYCIPCTQSYPTTHHETT